MHLLIVLLQQLLGMLPSAKKVLQPEAVRQGTPKPTGSEPDACSRIARSTQSWDTASWITAVCHALNLFLKSPTVRPPRSKSEGPLRAFAERKGGLVATFAEQKAISDD